MKTDKNARYQGYAFFFKEGFCWNNLLNPNARLLKAKLKKATVNDVGSMSLISCSFLPNAFFVSLLNSNIIFDYYREFINCTVNIQINDLRQIPVVIPSENDLLDILNSFQVVYDEKRKCFADDTMVFNDNLEKILDEKITKLYFIDA